MSKMVRVTAVADITWTGRNKSEVIVEKCVPVIATYNINVVTTEHQRRRALINWAEQQFRSEHMEYGKKGLTFGHVDVQLVDGTYYELGG